MNGALGLTGESGEIADLVKKHRFHGHELDKTRIFEECGDALWYIALIVETLGGSMEHIAQMNVSKLRLRYPEGFDMNRSINRSEKL